MKYLITLLLAALCLPGYSQKEIPAYGKIDIDDLKMEKCDFEPNASALKLIDYGDVVFEFGASNSFPAYASSGGSGGGKFRVKMTRRTRIKIFRKDGFNFADVKLRYYSKNEAEQITDLSAKTYNIDPSGKIVESSLEKNSVFKKKIDSRMSELVFTMPEVREGSIIEYKYNIYLESVSNLKDWYFQDIIPTRLSAYRLLIPNYFTFLTALYTNLPVEDIRRVEDHSASTSDGTLKFAAERRFFKMKNIPSVKNEPHMSSYRDYLQRVEFQLSKINYGSGEEKDVMSNWLILTNELLADEDFGLQLKKDIPLKDEMKSLLSSTPDPYRKMIIIYDHLRKNITWNGADGIYGFDGARTVWDRRSGSSGDINLLLINLLRKEGVSALPILVSTRDNGLVNEESPFLYQFNKVMAYVKIGKAHYVLNAAEKYCPAHLIPGDAMNTRAFVVDVMSGGFISLFNSKSNTNAVAVNGVIHEDGRMKGDAKIYSYDYARIPRTRTLTENPKNFKDYFTLDYSGLVVDSFSLKNDTADSLALEQAVHFDMPLNSSGNYKYFTLNLFSGLDKNPFLTNERITDIDFGINQSFTIHGNYHLSDGYTLVEKPKDLLLLSPDSSIMFQRLSQITPAGGLQTRITFNVKKPSYPASFYPDIKEFYQRMFGILDEQIVIQKK